MSFELGMYVHMHWGYNHPYAARTWTLDDWRGYAGGLRALGYDFIMIWPMADNMPDPLTPSDIAHLSKLRDVIAMLKSELGMSVLITFGANSVGNDRAGDYTFESRPYFLTEDRLNPGDDEQVGQLMSLRSKVWEYLSAADGMAIIDSDPGGYIGSTNAEFADLLVRHMGLMEQFNDDALLFYWMWVGWEGYNRFWEEAEHTVAARTVEDPRDWESVIAALADSGSDQWRLLACSEAHRETVKRLGIEDRSVYFPYGTVEGEPSYPLTNWNPDGVNTALSGFPWERPYLGCMANAQSHVVQLPHTYLFSAVARGNDPDLNVFAEQLVPGAAEVVVSAWTAIAGTDAGKARAAQRRLAEVRDTAPGPLSGLVIGGIDRYLEDLGLQLRFRAAMLDMAGATEVADLLTHLPTLLTSWEAWAERTGFIDAYLGPVADMLHPALRRLGSQEVNAALDDFDNWQTPSVRNGVVERLLKALWEIG